MQPSAIRDTSSVEVPSLIRFMINAPPSFGSDPNVDGGMRQIGSNENDELPGA
jgi:hypothetical protein